MARPSPIERQTLIAGLHAVTVAGRVALPQRADAWPGCLALPAAHEGATRGSPFGSIAGRPVRPAGRAGRPPGSWWRPDALWRLPLTAAIGFSTSAGVRYSRVRRSAFLRVSGATVRFTVAGGTSLRCDFAMQIARCSMAIVGLMRVFGQYA